MPAHDELTWQTTDRPDHADAARVDEGLDRHNHASADLDGVQPFACLAHDASGALVAGANARRWGACCEIQQMWVDESLRGQGLGARLVREIEAHARAHGCTLLFLETFSFQAPTFYKRMGLEIACELPGFPGGVSKFIMRKALM